MLAIAGIAALPILAPMYVGILVTRQSVLTHLLVQDLTVVQTISLWWNELTIDTCELGTRQLKIETIKPLINFKRALSDRPNDSYARDAIRNAEASIVLRGKPIESVYDTHMQTGYKATKNQDYQTALINFRRALGERPNDSYAMNAIHNTENYAGYGRQQSLYTSKVSALTERVNFDLGATSTIVQGRIEPKQVKRYLLNCNQKQLFTVQVLQGNINVTVISPDGQIIGKAESNRFNWQGTLPSAGDYVVEVAAPDNSNYTLSFEVL